MLNWLAHLLRIPMLPWPLCTVHLLPLFSPPPLSSLAPIFSPPPLFRTQATPVYSGAFSFIVQLQGCLSMLISPWLDWILKGRGSRRRWAMEREREWERLTAELSGPSSMGERIAPGSVMAGWETLHPFLQSMTTHDTGVAQVDSWLISEWRKGRESKGKKEDEWTMGKKKTAVCFMEAIWLFH